MSKKFDNDSLSHTRWNCKYHIVFAPKYRRQIIYGKIKNDIGKILRTLCERKGVEIIEAEACSDHIHMLVSIPPKIRKFWAEGYYVDTVGKNKKVIEEYIKKQLQEDIATDQIVMKEFVDPFTGEKNEITKKKKGPFQW